MKAVIRDIEAWSEEDWQTTVDTVSNPYKSAIYLMVSIGNDTNKDIGDFFEVCVANKACRQLALDSTGKFRGIVVDQMDSTSVQAALREKIESIEANDWHGIVEELCKFAKWEYEGIDNTGYWP